MAVYSTSKLSGSTNGRPIVIASTANPGTTIHTVSTATAILEYPYIWACNQATAARQITLQFGGTATTDEFFFTVPAQDGSYAIVPGWVLIGATDVVVRAYGTATAGLIVAGYVDKAT